MTTEKKKKGIVREYAEAIFFALLVALFLRHFFIEAFKIPSGSMIPTLLVGDHIFVNKFVYGTRIPFTTKKIRQGRTPERGEIVVFIFPEDLSTDYIKRVVGIPGDKIEVKNDVLFVNDEEVKQDGFEKFLVPEPAKDCSSQVFEKFTEHLNGRPHGLLNNPDLFPTHFGPVFIKPGHLFVMGDNRDNSYDSRSWGEVPLNLVKGRALFIWLSIDGCGLGQGGMADKVKNLLLLGWIRPERFFQVLR